jgi:hypothetical protein
MALQKKSQRVRNSRDLVMMDYFVIVTCSVHQRLSWSGQLFNIAEPAPRFASEKVIVRVIVPVQQLIPLFLHISLLPVKVRFFPEKAPLIMVPHPLPMGPKVALPSGLTVACTGDSIPQMRALLAPPVCIVFIFQLPEYCE